MLLNQPLLPMPVSKTVVLVNEIFCENLIWCLAFLLPPIQMIVLKSFCSKELLKSVFLLLRVYFDVEGVWPS